MNIKKFLLLIPFIILAVSLTASVPDNDIDISDDGVECFDTVVSDFPVSASIVGVPYPVDLIPSTAAAYRPLKSIGKRSQSISYYKPMYMYRPPYMSEVSYRCNFVKHRQRQSKRLTSQLL